MWVRVCMAYEIWILNENLVQFRVQKHEKTTSGDKLESRSRLFFEYYSILKNYLRLRGTSKLGQIFTSVNQYKVTDTANDSAREANESYAYAMALINEGQYIFAKYLGIEIIYDLLGDDQSKEWIWSNYQFGCREFAVLTARYGIPNITVEQYENELACRDRELERLVTIENDYRNLIAERDSLINERDSLYATNKQTVDHLGAIENERNAAILKLEVLTEQLEAIKIVRDAAMAHRDSAITERDLAAAQRDAAIAERDSAQSERDSISASLNAVHIELNSTKLALDAAVKELDSVKNELHLVFSSRSWRMTEFLRYPKRTITHH
jgi:hypothetical protein